MIRLFATIAVLVAPTAFAYDFMDTCSGQPTRWARGNPNTTWRLSTSHPSADLSASTVGSAMTAAFDEWSNPGCSEFDAGRGADQNADPGGNSTSNLVGFYESSWPGDWGSTTIALTFVTYSPTSCLLDSSDMVFNGIDNRFATSASFSTVDLQSVAVHEAGHWLGLDHSSHTGSSLWPSYSGGTDERTLTCDDTEGVCRSHASGQNTCTDNRFCACGVDCDGSGVCDGAAPVDPGPGSCTGTATSQGESEPNDWTGEEDVDWFTPAGGGDFSVTGRMSCGNNGEDYTADSDWFVIDFPCADDARFKLDWTGSADLDFYVWDTSSNEPIAGNNEAGTSGPVTDDGSAGGRVYANLACWEGSTVNYTFTVDFEPFAGTTVPDDPCEGITWEGECQGDTAVWCQEDTLMEEDCSNDGGCGLTEEYGYWCLGGVDDTDTTDTDDTAVDPGVPWIPGCDSCNAVGNPSSALGLLSGLAALAATRRRRSAGSRPAGHVGGR